MTSSSLATHAATTPAATPSPRVRVSVIVPVFNPGAGFDELIASLDAQTLDASEFEVLLCDDGSPPPTGERLEQIAASRSNVRVLTLPHTGWPGTPRNHGIQAAQGDYVFFADQDDRLFPAALEEMSDYADRHASDVVVGRVVGVGRRIPRQVFRRDIPRAELGRDPLLELLTPHKLFRRSFVLENDIRFPDGRVRLEDHLFVMKAYFTAGVISILASRPCYAWVKHPGSASSSRIDPDTYFPHLEAVLDLVEANTEPGMLRDTLLRHWYRGKILKRLGGRRMVRYPDAYRTRFLDVVIPLVQQRFGPAVEDGLPFPLRIRSALLRADRRDALVRLAEFEADLECRAEIESIRWTREGRLRLAVNVRITCDGEDALQFDAATSGSASASHEPTIWRAPAGLGPEVLAPATLDARKDLLRDRIELVVRDSASAPEYRIRGSAPQKLTPASLTIDPLRLFGRRDSSRGGPLIAEVRRAGWTFETPVRADAALLNAVGRSPALAGRRLRLLARSDGTVEVRREWPRGRGRDFSARAVRRVGGLVRRASRRVRGVASKRDR